ncbi:hypothetical protein DPMN_089539 [Dreissena polymorpha]|uniref:Uncharacterized protein n=1 Tax=Dreissena polymorpha TaxID=45954 RepID=A0A9D4KWL4_DREPO|nr:hypothetical protein DPMN_089539 [Dreissena polymorpha]
MHANPDKFQAIAIGKRTASKNLSLDISNANIKCDDVVKLLGVNLDSNLNVDHHISLDQQLPTHFNLSIQDLNGKKVKTKFHEDWPINVANIGKTATPPCGHIKTAMPPWKTSLTRQMLTTDDIQQIQGDHKSSP